MSKKKLTEQLQNYNITEISYCRSCNAYTVTINEESYSVHKDNFFKFFPEVDEKIFKKSIEKVIFNNYSCCNWCANHWGLDICACGSGEPFETCEEYDKMVCGKPMQEIDKYTHVRGANSWV